MLNTQIVQNQPTSNPKKLIFSQLQSLSQEACDAVLNGSNPVSVLSNPDKGMIASETKWQVATGYPKNVYKTFEYKGCKVSLSDRKSHILVFISKMI